MVRITRRDFMKYCAIGAGALGLSASTLMKLDKAIARETTSGGIPVIWLDGAACTGCSVTLLNSTFYTDAADLLINTLDLNVHKTVMTAAGAYIDTTQYTGTNLLKASQNIYGGYTDNGTALPGNVPLYVLVVEGGIQCSTPPGGAAGDYCINGELTTEGGPDTMLANTQLLASHALAVLSVGTCASFGGIPGARGSATDSRGTLYKGTKSGRGALVDPSVAYTTGSVFTNAVNLLTATNYAFTTTTPLTNILAMPIQDVTINIPGCPPHPDWIVGTIASIVSGLPPIASILDMVNDIIANPSGTALPLLQSTLAAALPQVTNYKRPVDYGYREYQCNAGPCAWRYNNTQSRAKNTDQFTNPWQANPNPYSTQPNWYTGPGGPAGTTPGSNVYTGSADFNRRYPQGDSKKLGRVKWATNVAGDTGAAQGCLGILGCKGRKTKADCSGRRWNTADAENYGVNWCVGSRGNCHGCTEPTFPDGVGKFYTFI